MLKNQCALNDSVQFEQNQPMTLTFAFNTIVEKGSSAIQTHWPIIQSRATELAAQAQENFQVMAVAALENAQHAAQQAKDWYAQNQFVVNMTAGFLLAQSAMYGIAYRRGQHDAYIDAQREAAYQVSEQLKQAADLNRQSLQLMEDIVKEAEKRKLKPAVKI